MCDSVSGFANLGQIFEKFRPQLLLMLQRRMDPVLEKRVDPDDILAEAFLAARNRWPKVKSQFYSDVEGREEKLQYAWLYRISRDTLIERYRFNVRDKRDMRRDMPWSQAGSSQLCGLMKQGTSPDKAVLRTELQEEVRRVVGLLKDSEREVLWMRHEDQLNFAQIGFVLEITENAATVRYTRALRQLRELWKNLHAEWSGT
jgi:RNA polymerase sigma-70 factor, ECF subfamily